MGKVTISTVLGYKEYVVENIKKHPGERMKKIPILGFIRIIIRFIEDRRRSS